MHIITGMLLAGLMRRRKGTSLLPMLRTGPVQTAHAMPGRVRFRIPSLIGGDDAAGTFQERMSSLEGVDAVDVSTVTGSVAIRYRENVVRAELLFAATVRLLGLDEELKRTPRPAVVCEIRGIMDSLNRAVYDRTGGLLDFSSAVLILMAGLGITKLVRDGTAAMPAGFTLLWWGFHQLLGHGGEE
jgi:hypothetical protein